MSTCFLCGHKTEPADTMIQDVENAMDHIRVMHPDQYEESERWPDGGLVLEDETVSPEDFQ